jgi:transcriptional regulator GlxA family with amidase domain
MPMPPTRRRVKWLRGLARSGVAIGGISLGHSCWPTRGCSMAGAAPCTGRAWGAFAERYPRVRTTTDIFVIDGDRFTCAGGTSAMDMMLQVITERDGRALANDVSEQFIHPHIRGTQDPQRMAVQSRLGVATRNSLLPSR